METIMFAVGALTMVLLAVASLAVYSTVMVLKLKKETHIDRTEIWRNMHENHQIVHRKFEDVERQLRSEMFIGEQELSNQLIHEAILNYRVNKKQDEKFPRINFCTRGYRPLLSLFR